MKKYDIIVVGAGHAGAEAASAAARMGCQTLLLTMNADQIGAMSCNPAIGGLGKSQLAREIDALGGLMCRIADRSAMQYRILNETKGAAVRATRVQTDRHEYRSLMKWTLESQDRLEIKQGQVTKLLFEGGRLVGVETGLQQKFFAKAVIITTGTFMNGKAHIGKLNFASGRAGEAPSIGLSDFLGSMGVRIGRLKTGTVPRVDARSIDFSKTEEQPSLTDCASLSFFTPKLRSDLMSAFITYTNDRTHEIIRRSLHESPLYAGIIESIGPRYCPSVEDKVVRFEDKARHQVFLEREGRQTNEVYVGGLSTSLSYSCQVDFLRSIPGLENVEIIRAGYAIEYDYIDATQLAPHLEMRDMPGLYFAGQVNGTSGYEEAAAQGLLAGLNAALKVKEKEPWVPSRSEAYLGVLVDDLVTKPTTEPYRIFTSRAEWRLLLRQDNVEERLMPKAFDLGLVTESEYSQFAVIHEKRTKVLNSLHSLRLNPSREVNSKLQKHQLAEIKTPIRAAELLRRPGVSYSLIRDFFPELDSDLTSEDLFSIETEVKYEGYISQAKEEVERSSRNEKMKIPSTFDFSNLAGLTREAIERLKKVRPTTLGQASRIEGITPASISVLAIHLAKKFDNDACVERRGTEIMKPEGKRISG